MANFAAMFRLDQVFALAMMRQEAEASVNLLDLARRFAILAMRLGIALENAQFDARVWSSRYDAIVIALEHANYALSQQHKMTKEQVRLHQLAELDVSTLSRERRELRSTIDTLQSRIDRLEDELADQNPF